MNTINKSTGFSPFQPHLGHSPHILPPLIPTSPSSNNELSAETLLECMHTDMCEARNNLMAAKISQAVQANKYCAADPVFKVGDFVMLNTANRHREFREKADGHSVCCWTVNSYALHTYCLECVNCCDWYST